MNPYKSMIKKVDGSTVRLPGQSGVLVGRNGEINASSKKDAIYQIGQILSNFEKSPEVVASNAEVRAERIKILGEAFADNTGTIMAQVGEALAAEISETSDREGFARRVLQVEEIGVGEINQVTVKMKQVMGFTAVSPSEVIPSEFRQKRIIPPEFHLNGYILIDTLEIGRASGDVLEESFEDGLEAVMVQEDRLWKTMADSAAGIRNTVQSFTTFTPTVFATQIDQVARWGIPATTCILNSSLWIDVIGNNDFHGALDPVTKWELIQEGFLATMYGCEIYTDAYRMPNLRVTNPGEIYVVGAPQFHGALVVRGGITSEPINRFSEGIAKRGWFMDQITSMVMANAMSVAKGQKI